MTIERDAKGRVVPFKPTDDMRAEVRALAVVGIAQDRIARVLKIDPKTLREHFADELEHSSAKATARVGGKLFSLAIEGNVAAAIFWMKARAGWSERQKIEVFGPGGGPVQHAVGIGSINDLAALTDAQLARLYQSEIGASSPDGGEPETPADRNGDVPA